MEPKSTGFIQLEQLPTRFVNHSARNFRNYRCDYFSEIGAVPWRN